MTNVAIFDLDGTLVDSPRAIVETFTAAFASMDVEPRAAAAVRATIGLPLEQAFSKLLDVPLDDAQVARGVKQYQLLFREIILPRASQLVFPGVAQGLTTLRDQGIALAIATSKFYKSAHALLEAAALRDYFAVVVGADQVRNPKPHPEAGQLIMGRLDTSAERAVMVGDTTHDLLMAKAAGMRSVAVTYGIHSVAELTEAEPTWIADTFAGAVQYITDGFVRN